MTTQERIKKAADNCCRLYEIYKEVIPNKAHCNLDPVTLYIEEGFSSVKTSGFEMFWHAKGGYTLNVRDNSKSLDTLLNEFNMTTRELIDRVECSRTYFNSTDNN